MAYPSYRHYREEERKRAAMLGCAFGIVIMIAITLSVASCIFRQKFEYVEYLNGWELQAVVEQVSCWEDSGARHYWVDTRTRVVTTTDSEGHLQTHIETYTVDVPYTQFENNWIVKTSVGDFLIGDRWLPTNPNDYRFNQGVEVPEARYIETTGIPDFWAKAKKRLDNKKPKHVTKKSTYYNFIYGSDSTILKTHTENINKFKLPQLQHLIFDFYNMDKVYNPPTPEWQRYCSRFNAELGRKRQGDLYTVFVKDNVNPEKYSQALFAYWTSKEAFKKQAMSKNALLLIIGTDGKVVKWARLFTAMPCGNNYAKMRVQSELKGKKLDPKEIFGEVNYKDPGNSDLAKILIKGNSKYKRDEMKNYVYLK